MLLPADRGCPSYRLWGAAAAPAELLWRIQADLHLPVQRVLRDGSYLSRWTDPADSRRQAKGPPPQGRHPTAGCAACPRPGGTRGRGRHRGLYRGRVGAHRRLPAGDHGAGPTVAPAVELAATYAKRWVCETGIREIKACLRGSRRALRGTDPDVARQERWAYLIVYQAIRLVICHAALRGQDLKPARISFTAARDAVQDAIAITPRRVEGHAEGELPGSVPPVDR
jgi:hypothetical protein